MIVIWFGLQNGNNTFYIWLNFADFLVDSPCKTDQETVGSLLCFSDFEQMLCVGLKKFCQVQFKYKMAAISEKCFLWAH